jgi:hypothetical protein
MNGNEGVRSLLLALRAFDNDHKIERILILNMNQLTQSLEREGSSRFAFLSRGLAFLARPSAAV